MKIINWARGLTRSNAEMLARMHKLQEALGRIESRQIGADWPGDLMSAEYRVFSQWGEDGIIQALQRQLPIERKIFVEFGVQNYTESNTRYLLTNNNWSGLVLDGSAEFIAYIRNDPIYWQYNLKAECSFITRENINTIIHQAGVSGEIGLLSIDIDGNDYWVWREIAVVRPAIVVCEYNARFGPERAVTIPYRPDFVREKAHFSNIYYGASLRALYQLSKRKGYAFVGCNSAGNNAFFVRSDLLAGSRIKELTVEQGFVPNRFRESRTRDGQLAFLSVEAERELLDSLPLVDTEDTSD
jgi:hypothetical protein